MKVLVCKMFSNTNTWTKQGDVGESRAIYEYTRMGYTVSRTLFDSAKYDLIIDVNSILYKVQVKTTTHKTVSGIYVAALKTCGGNRSFNTSRARDDSDYDILFVLADNGNCWSIPSNELPRTSVHLTSRFDKYKIS